MEWLKELVGIPDSSLLNISLPKEKVVANVKRVFAQKAMVRELGNVQEIKYRAIYRESDPYLPNKELHIIEVSLHEPKYVKAIAEALQNAIPYQKLVIFSSGEKHLIFHGDDHGTHTREYQFTGWAYEEELIFDTIEDAKRQTIDIPLENDFEFWGEIPYKLSEIFRETECSEYISLRHLIDILKIREERSGEDLVQAVVSRLVFRNEVEYFDEIPFVLMSDADQQYREICGYYGHWWDGNIEDKRYGIDRQFEILRSGDYTSMSEAMDMLRKIENASFYHNWEHEDYEEPDDYCYDN